MIVCKEIAEYLRFVEDNPKKINKERSLLIKNIVLPTLRRNDVFLHLHLCIKRIFQSFQSFLL